MRLRKLSKCLVCAWTSLAGTSYAAGIVGDGGTATTISIGANGRQTVSIAPAIGGVSNNTYSSFNVSKAGADLNNVGINARTIINQVTSTNPSLIQGNINVLGPRANVILANPNGITVDGSSFTNTGHVVLSTGQVSFNDIQTTPTDIQRNIVLMTRGGTITIGPGGLNGDNDLTRGMINLDLIAKQLNVNGPVNNPYTTSTGGIRAIVGDSTATYDTHFSPEDNGHDWLIGTSTPGTKSNAVAVDITAAGGLTAGRVQLIVTDQGAGVRSLGKIYASAGDVVLTSTGDVTVADGSIKAERDVSITTPGAVTLQGAQMSAANNTTVQAGSIALSDDASGRSFVSAGSTVSLTSSGAISNTGSQIQAGTTASDGSTSGGDVVLKAGGDITNRSTASNTAVVVADNGNVTLDAGGVITNNNARVQSNGTTSLAAGSDVTIADGSIKSGGDMSITTPGALSIQGAQLGAGHDATVQAGSVALSEDVSGPATLSAGNAVTVTSKGAIANTGSMIQAGTVASDGSATGGDITLNADGDITNRSTASNLGIVFATNGNTKLTAGGNIINDNARFLSNGAIEMNAAGDVQNLIDHTGGTNGGRPTAYSDRGGSFLFFTHTTSGFNVDYGTVGQPDQLAYIAATHGPVTINARNFNNSGGIVQSNDSDVKITAQNAFTNAAVFSGQASYTRSCWIFCHADASSNVTPYGGTIQAGGNIDIKAGTVARNIGGNVFATGDIKVDAPITYAQGVTGYSAINQHRGFKAFFGSTWAQIIAMDVGGGFTANGTVTLTGDGVIDGGSFSGGKGVTAVGGITTVRAPSRTPVQIDQHLGLTTWWWR
ncbi:two-partner secretion domain-containing protein [Burkholderia vietnamiensis]|uniref:two-partner secretion domain-containing protein n=1 Tax=Burkholderia vietnamiensis TaxID=60552 RepID=UPI001CF0E9F4|nr:filamentous hemagglutinin N-terminal domain-containing protein [Burkholderia vietnamiensis]MCA7988257.1 filamentous hemagglutinin N-terminal domain-containing protein [Burkholderia vietnamiensis]HDR8934506.1 filamentous hemagglutinin N-terminal domain-containing protein [Burkholderia vietnamiensis]